jgi:copper(I)-binding protein
VRHITVLSLATLLAIGIITGSVEAFQPTVRASEAWIHAAGAGSREATAVLAIDNGTMYDVFIVGAHTEVAAIELRDRPKGAAAPVTLKEVAVPAFGRLEMSPASVHLHLSALKRSLVAGEAVELVLYTDGGEQLTVSATVK